MRHVTHRQVDPRVWTDCKLYYFLFYFGSDYSSMLLVLMSLQKCFVVYFPLKSKTVCTVRTAKWATGISGIILAGYDSLFFFVIKAGVIESSGYDTCVYIVDIRGALDIIDSIIYSFLPFTFMFLTNCGSVFKFMRAKCHSSSTESTDQALSKSATRGTAMVVTVSVTFLLLTAPTAVAYARSFIIRLEDVPSYRVFMNLTQYLNHNVNGVLYIVVGSRFRNELFKIICRKGRPEVNSSTRSSCNTGLHRPIHGAAIRIHILHI